MRRLLTFVVAAIATCVPALAWAGNQEIAEAIAKNLKASGRMSDYKIGVNFKDGTAWLNGRVRNEQQMTTALRLAVNTPGVERVVNNLSMGSGEAAPIPRTSAVQPASAIEMGYPAVQGAPQMFQPNPAQRPVPVAYRQPNGALTPTPANGAPAPMPAPMASGAPAPLPMHAGAAGGTAPMRYDQPHLPNYAWPSYAAYPNYAALTYPKQYSPTAWPYIGPFYPYPQVPLGWRKVTLEWDDGWWFLDFQDRPSCHKSPLGRWY